MLTDWTYWLSSVPRDELLPVLIPLLIFDTPRYFVAGLLLWLIDASGDAVEWLGRSSRPRLTYCPSVCVVIAGLNEADSLRRGLGKLWGSYPRMEIVVVDDGSSDGMSRVANEFASGRSGVHVITKKRGGKSSAMNAALPLTNAEVIIVLDADSELSPGAIWEVVQPLQDPKVGAASGNVRARNHSTNLVTRCQAAEYLRSILVGRMISSRLGLLGIVSGAFGAFRRSALERIGGWDVGPGEDEDVVLRLRKLGYHIEFVPEAECCTDVPESWKVLTKQRRRWEWAVVTFEARKHIDMANLFSANFQLSNCLLVIERWLFNLFLPIVFWLYLGWQFTFHRHEYLPHIFFLYYLIYVCMEYFQLLLVLYYSNRKWQDARLWLMPTLMPIYMVYQRCITSYAILEEMLTRRSFRDSFVPDHVREATWHW